MSRKDIYNFTGKTLDKKYKLISFVDEGGMGLLYLGTSLQDDNRVAVKILHPRYQASNDRADVHLGLFRRETDLLSRLKHKNIVTILDSGHDDGLTYIVMEWLDGMTLGQKIQETGGLPIFYTNNILRQICDALQSAHGQNIVHLDIKPNNVFLSVGKNLDGEVVKIIDFGLSRIVQSTLGSTLSRVMGTPQYIAPEIFSNRVSSSCDIYSLGILTFEMLTGVLPYSNTQIWSLAQNESSDGPPSVRQFRPQIPEKIDVLIQEAIARDPALRPRSAHAFATRYKTAAVTYQISWPAATDYEVFQTHRPSLSRKVVCLIISIGSLLTATIAWYPIFFPFEIFGFVFPVWAAVASATGLFAFSFLFVILGGYEDDGGVIDRIAFFAALPSLIVIIPLIGACLMMMVIVALLFPEPNYETSESEKVRTALDRYVTRNAPK